MFVDELNPRHLLLVTSGRTQDPQVRPRRSIDQLEVKRVEASHRLLQRHVVHLNNNHNTYDVMQQFFVTSRISSRCTYLEGGPEDEAGWGEVVALLHFATEDDDLLEEEDASVFCANVTRFGRAT